MQSLFFNPLTFPLWWYTSGFVMVLGWARESLRWTLKKSGLRLFFRHFGDTLYGYNSRADRIISFFVRLFLAIFKIFWLLIKIILLFLALLLYLSALPLVAALIAYYFVK